MNQPEFKEFQKIARLNREVVVTEKIDGTNGLIYIPDGTECDCGHEMTYHAGHCNYYNDAFGVERCKCQEFKYTHKVFAGSRSKWVTPEDDNFGFAKWVEKNRDELLHLGPGYHYGEWWGKGIQRGYSQSEKRFSLFNVKLWGDDRTRPHCCDVVPVITRGLDIRSATEEALAVLRTKGSVAAPGFMKPEGVVVFHTASNHLFKVTLEKDSEPKGKNNG